ncbi:MAG TPA: HAD family hydrolase [Firmicutes bacterium]|jgi:D-glycero-D-manno-heptose 1,7-bisphosphate phosphatase|nr:MAG: hypothetical protein AA931_09425 [Peptococcaceae bacterium 1109]HHT73657.1 HAD family hydrolase [Bacillota bacterium]
MEHRAVFLDRDGVLNRSIGKRPPNTPEELEMLPGAAKAVKELNDAGFKVFVVTNQGGVALGYMTKEDLEAIHARLQEEVAREGGVIHEIAACTHRPWAKCNCRKPKPGMLIQLARRHKIDLENSFMVGDREMDILAGQGAGTTTILVGDGEEETTADYAVADLAEAARLIIEQLGPQLPPQGGKS